MDPVKVPTCPGRRNHTARLRTYIQLNVLCLFNYNYWALRTEPYIPCYSETQVGWRNKWGSVPSGD